MDIKPIIKISTTHQVVERIKSLIDNGEYKAGEKLPSEKQLCEQLQVSRSTLREATRILEAMEYIEVIHGRGSFVSSVQNKSRIEKWFENHKYQLKDIMDVRLAIESLALKSVVKNIKEEDILKLEKIQGLMYEAMINESGNQMALYDELFHEFLVKCSKNELIVALNELITRALRAYRLNAFAIKENREHAIGPHQQIIEALRLRDYKLANKAIIEHINISVNDMSRVAKTED